MFAGKKILITGASSGIGASLARRLAAEGAELALVARRKDRLDALCKELEQKVGRPCAHVVPGDVLDEGVAEQVVTDATRRMGQIDILINNAGIGEYGLFEGQDIAALERMMRLNMTAVVWLTRRLMPEMIARGGGHIVNIASMAAFQPTPYMAVYGATKAFVLSFSMALWEEVRRRGVQVTCICPGPVKTEFFDRGGYEVRKADYAKHSVDPDWIADVACKAIRQGKTVRIPGWKNGLMTWLERFATREAVTRITGKLLAPRPLDGGRQ